MSENLRKTVDQIASFVKPIIDEYRQFPAKQLEVIKKLEVVFHTDSEYLMVVVKDNRFSEAFFRKMGKGRMKALKKLLLLLDQEYYKDIDFKEE